MKQIYTTDRLITGLRYYWAQAEGLEYGPEHELMKCAADWIERQAAYRVRLERKIHNQRANCRINWEIVEMRRKWMGSKVVYDAYCRLVKRYRELLRASGG